MMFDSKRSFFNVLHQLFNRLLYNYILNISVIHTYIFKSSSIYGSSCERSFYEGISFRHYLQHYSGIIRSTEIQFYLWVHRPVCCNTISSITVKSYKYWRELAFRPVSNSFCLYPSLIKWPHWVIQPTGIRLEIKTFIF